MFTTLAMLAGLVEYEASIVALAQREIRRWATVASTIPDPTLRRLATEALAIDASNAEAAAAFALTTPRRLRRTTVGLLVAHQLLLDYVDMLGEQFADLRRGVAIGSALPAAIDRSLSTASFDPLREDGGYLVALVAVCRRRLWQLPSAVTVEQQAKVAATRCAEALARTHTAARDDKVAELRRWTTMPPCTDGYSWWEVAAGGNSNLGLLALLAAAADPATTQTDAVAIASAYWPHVCVMSTLLDSLVDYERDTTCVNFSFISEYRSRDGARDGLIHATQRSLAAVKPLRHSHAHTMIVCGVAGYYAASAAPGSLAAELAPSIVAELGGAAAPIILALRARHRRSCCPRPVRSGTAAFLTRSRGSVRGPGGSGSSTTNCDGTGDSD